MELRDRLFFIFTFKKSVIYEHHFRQKYFHFWKKHVFHHELHSMPIPTIPHLYIFNLLKVFKIGTPLSVFCLILSHTVSKIANSWKIVDFWYLVVTLAKSGGHNLYLNDLTFGTFIIYGCTSVPKKLREIWMITFF